MPYQRIELCVNIPGPKTMDQPLEQIEIFALSRLSPFILKAIQENNLKRIIDYTGNYFLVFPSQVKEKNEK